MNAGEAKNDTALEMKSVDLLAAQSFDTAQGLRFDSSNPGSSLAKNNCSNSSLDVQVNGSIALPSHPRLAGLVAKRADLIAKLENLQSQHRALVTEARSHVDIETPMDQTEPQKSRQALITANSVIKEHIALLHKYNEIKDIGQGLMGMVAEKRGVRVATVMEDYGMDAKD